MKRTKPRMGKAIDSSRVKITTTLRADLWDILQHEAIERGRQVAKKLYPNDIIEALIEDHLVKRKGSR